MTTPDLTKSGQRLQLIDRFILTMIRQRMVVAAQVVAFKMLKKEPIVRQDIEKKRIGDARKLGAEIGLDQEFAASIEHQLIDHSCKVQLSIVEGNGQVQLLSADPAERQQQLKDNLVSLCGAVAATYNGSGGLTYPATQAYVDYENTEITRVIGEIPADQRLVAVDLGCAVGRVARFLSPNFSKVYGFDLSQHMVSEAWQRCTGKFENIDFQQCDLEEGIPLPDNSVDFAVMGLGTASDMHNLQKVLFEIGRVLRPHGKFLLSFYHRDALMYQEGHITIDGGLSAEVNVDEDCLIVHVPAHEVEGDEKNETLMVPGRDYLVYARPYTWSEVESILSGTPLTIDRYRSYPTIASVVPRNLLQNEKFMAQVVKLDHSLEYANSGAYYLVSGSSMF